MTGPDLPAFASPTAVVRALPFMAHLPADVRNLILAGFEERTYRFGETVSTPEDSAFVVVVEGEVRVVAERADRTEVSLGVLGAGQTSGERALVEDHPPGVTLRAASTAVRVLRLDRGVAVALARAHPEAAAAFAEQAHAKRIAAFLRTDDTFRDLDPKGVELIVARGRGKDARDGDVIVWEGGQTASWWIVESGRLVEHSGQGSARRDVRFLRAGDVFGEVGALDGSAQLTTVTAASECRLLELDAAVLDELGALDPMFASRLGDRARLHLSRVAVRPLDFAGGDEASGVHQRPPTPPPSPDERIAAGVDVSGEPPAPEQWVAPRRFPFVRQIDLADCGVAALAMICRAFGRKVSLPFLRHVAGTGQDGTSLRGIMRAAEEAGLEGHALKASKSRLAELQLPAILHWEGNHWIVVYAVDGDRVRVADPGRGLRTVNRAELDEKWSGWCATFRPTPRLDDAPVEHLDLGWVRPFVRPMRARLALATAMAIVATGLQLLAPVLTQRVVDAAAAGHSGRVSLLILLIVGLLFAGLGVSLLQRRMLARAAVRLDSDALDFVSGRLLQLPLKYFETRRTADIERRLNGLRQVRGLFVQGIVGGLSAVVQLVVTLFIMFTYSPVIALVFLATAPVYAGLMRYSSHRLTTDVRQPRGGVLASRRKAARCDQGHRGGQERGRGGRPPTGDPARVRPAQRPRVPQRLGADVLRRGRPDGGVPALRPVPLGRRAARRQRLAVDRRVRGRQLARPARQRPDRRAARPLGPGTAGLGPATAAAGRARGRAGAGPACDAAPQTSRRLSGRIALRQVALTYPDAPDRRILDDVTLVLEPGSTLGLVGRSGSGKSTLVRCLAGLVVPSNGSVLYDEVDMRELDWRQLRRRIGVVLQAPYLFDDTIAANIALGEDVPDMALVQRAAEIADAAGFIESMALGYDTKVGDSGIRLSGGQAQRVCIARALYHDPPVLLFDEATSALDTESEAAVKRNLDRVLEDRTAVIVAHRLSTIRDADTIAVLEQGRIVEHGTHDALLDRAGSLLPPAGQPGRLTHGTEVRGSAIHGSLSRVMSLRRKKASRQRVWWIPGGLSGGGSGA